MRVAIIGAGYVGLVSGACFADIGHHVTCADKDVDKIAGLLRGRLPIYEPGLQELVRDNVASGRLSFSTSIHATVADAEVIFIAVGTPSNPSNGQADLSFVFEVAREIAHALSDYTVVATKSTVPVGTGDILESIIQREKPGADVSVVSNPEFLREGSAIVDFREPDRIVIGTDETRARDVMAELYKPLRIEVPRFVVTGRRTAELIKYAANAFLATKITFINEIANLCEVVGADVHEVARGMGLDNRIGGRFLQPGPGYGGSCFPKDTVALLRTAQDFDIALELIEATVAVNDKRKRSIVRKVGDAVGGSVNGLTVAVLGLTFKPNTDDVREAPSLALIEALQREGAIVRAYDPVGMDQARRYLDDVFFAEDPYECVRGADAIVLMTEWECLCTLDLHRVRELMHQPIFIDMRNVYAEDRMSELGFAFSGIGVRVNLPNAKRVEVIRGMPSPFEDARAGAIR